MESYRAAHVITEVLIAGGYASVLQTTSFSVCYYSIPDKIFLLYCTYRTSWAGPEFSFIHITTKPFVLNLRNLKHRVNQKYCHVAEKLSVHAANGSEWGRLESLPYLCGETDA